MKIFFWRRMFVTKVAIVIYNRNYQICISSSSSSCFSEQFAMAMASSPPHLRRICFLLCVVFSLLSSSLVASDSTALIGVEPGRPALNVSLTSCERIQVSGYPRTKLEKYAHSFSVKLAPLVTVPKKLQSKIQICVHRNASLGMCQCNEFDWKNLHMGLWSSVMSPYDKQYLDVKFSGASSGSVTVSVAEDIQQWRLLCLVAGLIFILLAPVLSSWVPFYYTSSVAVGVFLVILTITFQIRRLLPTGSKNLMYLAFFGTVLGGAGSFIQRQFSMMENMILVRFGLSDDMYNLVAILVLMGIVITGSAFGHWTVRKFVVSEDGGVDARVAQFVKWAMRSVAAAFISQSTLDAPLAMGAFISASLLSFLVSKMVRKRKTVV